MCLARVFASLRLIVFHRKQDLGCVKHECDSRGLHMFVSRAGRHLRGQGTEVDRESHLIRIRILWEIWDISHCDMLCGNLRVVTHWRMGHHHHYHHHNDTSLMIIMTPRQHHSERYRVTGRGPVLTPSGDLSSFESVSTSSSSFVCQFLPPMLLFTPC